MSFIAAAVIGGGAALASGYMASKSADKASSRASASDAAMLEFEREKYADWRDTYGDIESNLAEYYGSLTPDFYASRGLEEFQKEYQLELENVRSTLAQRGIEDSGLAIAVEKDMGQQRAMQRAQIRATAPSMAAEEKRQFLQIGLGQNPGQSLSSALATRASNASSAAQQAQESAGRAMSTGIRVAGSALSDYLTSGSGGKSMFDVGQTSANQYTDYSGYV